MPEFRETSACIGFSPALLQVGNDLLIYAQYSNGAYFTDICLRTQLAKNARHDFKSLGAGRPPK